MAKKTVKVQQIGSPLRREHTQRETLVGLGLNKNHRVRELDRHAVDPRHDRQGGASRARSSTTRNKE